MTVTLFTDPGEQRRAPGVFSFAAAGGSSVGLLAGGPLTGRRNSTQAQKLKGAGMTKELVA